MIWPLTSIARRLAGTLLAVLLAAASVAAATATPDPDRRYQVVEVAADDQLNVREQPGVEGEVLGWLAFDDEDVVVTGAVMDIAGSQWWELVFDGTDGTRGWVNGRFLAPVDEAPPASGYPLLCGGTEPFWSLELEDMEARYRAIDEDALAMTAGPWRMASGAVGRFAVELEHDGQPGYAGVWRERDFCSDGMSDIRYPFGTIVARPGGEVVAGCCRRAR